MFVMRDTGSFLFFMNSGGRSEEEEKSPGQMKVPRSVSYPGGLHGTLPMLLDMDPQAFTWTLNTTDYDSHVNVAYVKAPKWRAMVVFL